MIMNNNLKRIEKELRGFAKRCKDVKYNSALLFTFLLTGLVSFSAGEADSVEQARKGLQTSITDMKKLFKEAKHENNNLLKSSNLELIQAFLSRRAAIILRLKNAALRRLSIRIRIRSATGTVLRFTCFLNRL